VAHVAGLADPAGEGEDVSTRVYGTSLPSGPT
jgi:hypothetical protein